MNDDGHKTTNEEMARDALIAQQDKLYALIRMLMIRSSQDALDVLQDTNTAILEHAAQYSPDKSAWPWFARVAMNQVRMYFRSKAHSPLAYDTDLMDSLAGDIEEGKYFHGIVLEEYLDALKHCMGKLPPLKRELLHARYVNNQLIPELAAKYRLSADSLAQFFCRARRALKDCIQKFIHFRASTTPFLGAYAQGQDENTFLAALGLLVDNSLPKERADSFVRELASSPERRAAYMEQAFLNAFLECRKENLFQAEGPSRPVYRIAARGAVVAAAFAALFVGGIYLLRMPQKRHVVVEQAQSPRQDEASRTAAETGRREEHRATALVVKQQEEAVADIQTGLETKSEKSVKQAAATPQKTEERNMNKASIKAAAVMAAAAGVVALTPALRASGTQTSDCDTSPILVIDTRSAAEADISPFTVETRSCDQEDTDSRFNTIDTAKPLGTVIMLI